MVLNLKTSRAIAIIEVMYKTQKKQQEIELLKKSQEFSQKEIARQRIIQVAYLTGFLFSVFAVIAIYLALKVKRKANIELLKQKEEIEKSNKRLNQQQDEILKKNEEINIQRNNISQKNKNLEEAYSVIESYIGKITDNIRYAQRIQKAILTPIDTTIPYFSDSFCLYLPKDFVSGDFYWMIPMDDSIFIAAADCTGHGVPGAFMSIIGLDILNQAVIQQHITEPADILDFLNIEIRKKLRKDDEEAVLKDSMDIAICRFDKKTQILHYSGALIPVMIIRNGEVIEHKASPISIGISASVYSKKFEQKAIQLQPNDWIYLYSDGFTDQFGNGDGTKFLRKRLYSTLTSVSPFTGKKQHDELHRAFIQWKGNLEQIDDVLVMGLKVM
jgi:serine phosphatase RsbU (regulator of sigma subunit)